MGVYGTLVSDTAIYLFSTLYVEYLINKNPNSLTMRDWCSSTGMWKWGDSKQLSVGWSGPPGRLQLGEMAKRCWLCGPEINCLRVQRRVSCFSMLLFLNKAS